MLLNLASDKPFIYNNWEFIFFERKELENQLPSFFYENKENIKTLYIITWPGYFSSTRVGVEVINILFTLNVVENLYFLNKLEFFYQNGFDDIYLFSGNKNKFILLKKWWNYDIVFKKDLDLSKYFEELLELKLENIKTISYKKLLKNYEKINWNNLEKNHLLKPFYIFEPIIC